MQIRACPDNFFRNLQEAEIFAINVLATSTVGVASVVTPSAASFTAVATSTPPSPDLKNSSSPGTIAAAVLGSMALVSVLAFCGWIFWQRRRRHPLRPTPAPKIDLVEPEADEKLSSRTVDLLDGEYERPRPRSPTFPWPFDRVVRRHHPNAPHSIEPSRSDSEIPDPPPPDRPMPRQRHIPIDSVPEQPAHAQTTDQIEQDLADLRGSGRSEERSEVGRSSSKERKQCSRLSFSFTGLGKNPPINAPSASPHPDPLSPHTERRAKGKYYHLPPSAQFLANVARYPQRVDPERPWEVPKNGG